VKYVYNSISLAQTSNQHLSGLVLPRGILRNDWKFVKKWFGQPGLQDTVDVSTNRKKTASFC